MSLKARAFVALQYVLPLHGLSALMHKIARLESTLVAQTLIRGFMRLYGVTLSEAMRETPQQYRCFNDFFTRALKPDARPIAAHPQALVSPCDGRISQIGQLELDQLLQATLKAKRHTYGLAALMASETRAVPFIGGSFACLYLAPHDYHRVHMPLAGQLRSAQHVPGSLFSVNEATARYVPGLFARNERIVMTFETDLGPMALIMVGALNVGSMNLAWHGDVKASAGRLSVPQSLPVPTTRFRAGDEIGRFNLGSTVIVLLPPHTWTWDSSLGCGSPVRMGQALGHQSLRAQGLSS